LPTAHEVDLLVAKNFNGNEQVFLKSRCANGAWRLWVYASVWSGILATPRRLRSIPMDVWMILALVSQGWMAYHSSRVFFRLARMAPGSREYALCAP
jgi:hypothetical protein